MAVAVAIFTILFAFIPAVISDDTVPVPSNIDQVRGWFEANVQPLAARKGTLDPALAAAEGEARTIKVRKDGSGNFKTVTEAVNSIPSGNTKRVVVWIGGGNYTEKIKVDRTKPFVTFYGSPNDMPTLVFGGTAKDYGTVDSASVIVESDYFSAVNVIIANSSPRPDGKRVGAQAAALRISGDKAAFYNTKIYGFQDTLCDDKGQHFFKDCYIEGTVDFIFGGGKSLYLNTELHVVEGPGGIITAQARKGPADDIGYSFVHCRVTGGGNYTGVAFLGRAWMAYARVIYSYTNMSAVVNPKGWSDNFNPVADKVFFGEYKCMGPKTAFSSQANFAKQLTDAEAKPFISLGFINGSKWLLPPTQL